MSRSLALFIVALSVVGTAVWAAACSACGSVNDDTLDSDRQIARQASAQLYIVLIDLVDNPTERSFNMTLADLEKACNFKVIDNLWRTYSFIAETSDPDCLRRQQEVQEDGVVLEATVCLPMS